MHDTDSLDYVLGFPFLGIYLLKEVNTQLSRHKSKDAFVLAIRCLL